MLLVASLLFAQQNPTQATTASVTAEASQPPGPGMKELIGAFLGTWSITETTVPRPGRSAGVTNSGTEKWRTATGGLTLIEENQTKLQGGDAHDTAVIWWDRKAQRIRGIWCADINSEGCSDFTVTWEAGHVIMVGEWEDDGGRHAWKEDFAFGGPDSFTQTLLVGPPGGDLQRVAVIRARRAKP